MTCCEALTDDIFCSTNLLPLQEQKLEADLAMHTTASKCLCEDVYFVKPSVGWDDFRKNEACSVLALILCVFNPQREEVVWDLSECSHTCGTCEGNLQALIKMDWSHIKNSTPRGAIHAVPRLYVDVPMYHWWANILQHLGRSNSQHWDIVAISSISTYINWCRFLSMNNRTRVEYRCSLLCLATYSEIDLELPILGKKEHGTHRKETSYFCQCLLLCRKDIKQSREITCEFLRFISNCDVSTTRTVPDASIYVHTCKYIYI